MVSRVGPSNALSEAMSAEAEARKRVDQARDSVRQARNEANDEIEQMRDEYRAQSTRESNQNRDRIASQENENYENLRRMKTRYQSEAERVKSEGERGVARTREFYDEGQYRAARDGNQRLKDLELRNQSALDAESRKSLEQRALFRQDQSNRMKSLEDERNLIEYRKTREKDAALARSKLELEEHRKHQEEYLRAHEQTLGAQRDLMVKTQLRNRERLENLIVGAEARLDAYSERTEDPFYRPIDLNARLTEHDEYYELRASIPEHEREGLVVSANLNEVILNGSRRYSQKYMGDENTRKETSAFQSYSEVLPVQSPVDPRFIEKRFEGDELIATIPKAGTEYLRARQRKRQEHQVGMVYGPRPVVPTETITRNIATKKPKPVSEA